MPRLTRLFLSALACFAFFVPASRADEPSDIRELKLKDWKPQSMLVTKETKVDKPMFPVIDVHNHLGGGKADLTPERVNHYLEEMDAAGVRTVIDLDGGWDDRLKQTIAALDEAHPGRFYTFALINFSGIDDEGWSAREAERLEKGFLAGAKGLKFHKNLGLTIRYKNGKLMPVDDPKLDPIWEMCAKYKKPVMIHSGDPAAFFTPLDRNSERWHELNAHPDWLFYGEKFPKREDVLQQFINVVAKHPATSFIGAHFGNNAEDIATVGKWLDAYPNLWIDIDARISELGRQPYSARKFLIKYQDRIMFGTDTPCNRESYRIYYRFLETDDEYFDPAASHHLQGFWMIYGIFLPKDVLEKIYHKNAERMFLGEPSQPPEQTSDAAAPTSAPVATVAPAKKELQVPKVDDFEVTGDGSAKAWNKAAWQMLDSEDKQSEESRFKVLYSDKGLYVLMDGADHRLTATLKDDFTDLYKEDAFEFFLWPDEHDPVYLEYEISPLEFETPILIPHLGDRFLGWRPWHYEGDKRTRKKTSVRDGAKESGAAITGWTAEVFVPYELFKPLGNVPPKSGTRWRANFYRLDYDNKQATGHGAGWHWAQVGRSFHEFQKFGTLIFE